MKLKIFATESRGLRYVKAVAVTVDSQKKRRQKTFSIRNVAPEYAVSEMQGAFQAAANRWQDKVLAGPQQDEQDQEQELTL